MGRRVAGADGDTAPYELGTNALPYAENAYLLTLRTEALVEGHFRCCGRLVLRACAAYMPTGCSIGLLGVHMGKMVFFPTLFCFC